MSLIKAKKNLGLVTEYNPFHNGHAYHLKASLELSGATASVAIMSGYFTQRGEPAIADPFTRAKWAVESGVDLVLQLPVLFSTASAPMFAFGALASLDALGSIDTICFGSESGDIDPLKALTKQLIALENDLSQQTKARADLSYNALRDQMLSKSGYNGPSSANDILGLAYLHALAKLRSSIEPLAIQRIQNEYHSKDLHHEIASATAVRAGLRSGGAKSIKHTLPSPSLATLERTDFTSPDEDLWHQMVLYELRRSTCEDLLLIHDMAVGLPQRLKEAASNAFTREAFYEAIQTKAYTNSRLSRVLAKMLLGIKRTDLENDFGTKPEYLRVLAFNDKGREILKSSPASLPIITNGKQYQPDNDLARRHWTLDTYAADLYNLLFKPAKATGEQMRKIPYYYRVGG